MKSLVILFLTCCFFSLHGQDLTPAMVVDQQLSAYNDRDIDGFLATYSEHIQIFEFGSELPYLEGKERLKINYMPMFEASPNLEATISNRIVHGNKVIDHETAKGINDREPVQVVVIYEVNNGLIEKVTFVY